MAQGGNYHDDIEFPESVLLGPEGVDLDRGEGAERGTRADDVQFLRPLDNPKIHRLTAPLLEQVTEHATGNPAP